MKSPLFASALLAAAVVACSSSSSPTGPSDAGTDHKSSGSAGESDTGSAGQSDTGSSGQADTGSSGQGEGGSGEAGGDAGAITWTSYAKGFFATYCVHCHDGTTEPQDFRQYAQVKALTSTIRCGVAPTLQSGCPTSGFPPPKQFPIGTGPFPSDADRLRIVTWINDGAPQ